MAEFTFLKLQFDDASFAANAPFSGSDDAASEGEGSDADESSSVLPYLLGLVFLVVVAVVVKKLLGGGSEAPAVDLDTDGK